MAKPDWIDALCAQWEREAADLERGADLRPGVTEVERRLQRMHARAKRGCAQELRIAASKVVNSGR